MAKIIRGNFGALKAFARTVGTLSMSNQMPVLKAGMAAAIRPIRDDAKSRAPVDEGDLRAAMADKVIGYPDEANVIGLVGVSKGFFGHGKRGKGKKRPANYAHLVEFGHRSVHGGGALPNYGSKVKGVWNAKNKGLSIRNKTIKATSYVAGRPFLDPAFQTGVANLEKTLGASVGDAMQKEFNKAQ